MGTGQKCFHAAEIHGVTALNAPGDGALDGTVLFQHVFELVEQLHTLGLVERKRDGAVHFVLARHVYIHSVTDFDGDVPLRIAKFFGGDLTFGLEVHVHQDVIVVHAHDLALDDGTFFKVAHIGGEIVFERALEVHFRVDLVFHGFFGSCHTGPSRPHKQIFPPLADGVFLFNK